MILRNVNVELKFSGFQIFGIVITTRKCLSKADIKIETDRNTIVFDYGLELYYD